MIYRARRLFPALWFFCVLAGGALFTTQVAAQAQYGAVCDGCTLQQYTECAVQIGFWYGASTGTRVFVLDFHNEHTAKYRLQVIPPGGTIDSVDSADKSSVELTSISQIIPHPEALTSDEAMDADALIAWTNDLTRPNGGGQTRVACPGSSTSGTPPVMAGESSEIQSLGSSDAAAVEIVQVPSNMAGSAYDVIGNQVFGIQIAQQIMAGRPFFNATGRFLNLIDRIFNIPLNTEAILLLEFSDGSLGIWVLNYPKSRWQADFQTFEDSDGNPIPHTPSDLVGNTYMFSNQNNLQNFLDRAHQFGIPITGPGGGIITECRMEGGNLRCFPRPGSD